MNEPSGTLPGGGAGWRRGTRELDAEQGYGAVGAAERTVVELTVGPGVITGGMVPGTRAWDGRVTSAGGPGLTDTLGVSWATTEIPSGAEMSDVDTKEVLATDAPTPVKAANAVIPAARAQLR